MGEVVDYVRAGKGPAAVEFDTERFFGHFEGDPQNYRGGGEIAALKMRCRTILERCGEEKACEQEDLMPSIKKSPI